MVTGYPPDMRTDTRGWPRHPQQQRDGVTAGTTEFGMSTGWGLRAVGSVAAVAGRYDWGGAVHFLDNDR